MVRKTYCIDCGTYIDSIAQSIAKTIDKSSNPWISTEEQALLDRVGEHDSISKSHAVAAAELMLAECKKLEPGEYSPLSIGNLFIDCADRALGAESTAMVLSLIHISEPTRPC